MARNVKFVAAWNRYLGIFSASCLTIALMLAAPAPSTAGSTFPGTVTPGQLGFPDTVVGASSAPRTVTLTSNAAECADSASCTEFVVTLSNLPSRQGQAASFTLSVPAVQPAGCVDATVNAAGTVVTADLEEMRGAKCKFEVTFVPQNAGGQAAVVIVNGTVFKPGGNQTATVTLPTTGLAIPADG